MSSYTWINAGENTYLLVGTGRLYSNFAKITNLFAVALCCTTVNFMVKLLSDNNYSSPNP